MCAGVGWRFPGHSSPSCLHMDSADWREVWVSPSLDTSLRSRAETQTLHHSQKELAAGWARAKAAVTRRCWLHRARGGQENQGHAGDGPVMRMRLRDPLTTCSRKGRHGAFLSG